MYGKRSLKKGDWEKDIVSINLNICVCKCDLQYLCMYKNFSMYCVCVCSMLLSNWFLFILIKTKLDENIYLHKNKHRKSC